MHPCWVGPWLPFVCRLSFTPVRLPILSLSPALLVELSLTPLLCADDRLYHTGLKVLLLPRDTVAQIRWLLLDLLAGTWS